MYDIIAKLGIPCIFIRYNPDSNESDKNLLLETVINYLNTEYIDNIYDDFGLKAEHLSY